MNIFSAVTASALNDPRPRRAGLKIEVNGSGIYRVTGEDIQNAGVNPNAIDPATFRMFRLDIEIPIIVTASGSMFEGSDAVEFYAWGIDNQYTGTDVYWLYWGGDAGKRMAKKDGSINGSPPVATTFKDLLTAAENHYMWPETPGAPEADYWFWEKLTSPQSATYSFNIYSPVNNSANAAVIVYFQGVTGVSSTDVHHTIISMNGNQISNESWQGEIIQAQTGTIQQTLLNSGQNQIKIECRRDVSTPDVVYFNRVTVEYQRRLSAINNELKFNLNQSDAVQVEVTGFNGSNIQVFDISDPSNPRRVSNLEISQVQSAFKVAFSHSGGEKTYLAITSDKAGAPDQVTYRKQSDLKKATNQADCILITSKDFMPAFENLAELRRLQGMTVKMVDIDEIYDVFSFGFFNPEAIHDFLQYAYQNWDTPTPQYVLLAGDANLDYRHYFGTTKQNIVPVYLDKTFELGLTPSDNYYGCMEGNDRVPELYIGRIPGDSYETISDIVNKLILYESTRYQNSKSALFVADDDEIAFETLSDDLAMYLPDSYNKEKVYTRLYSNLSSATQDIQKFVNQGMLITSFVGHGDVTRWGAEPYGGGDYILEPDDLRMMTNKNSLTFVLPLDCLNGYFSQPFQYSLAEEWVKSENGGAVACYAPSGLSDQWEHDFLSNIVFSNIFTESENRLGIIATQSKIDAYYAGVSDKILISFNLIGDPATRLAINRKPSDLVKVHSITATASYGGTVSPAGETIVFDKESRTYSISPLSGYTILNVTVDGITQDPVSTYTFNNVTTDHTIHAVFEQEKTSGGGGGGGGCFVMSVRQ